MKTTKRTKICPKCGEAITLQWQTFRGCYNERINYAEWRCPECGQKLNSIYKNDKIDFARFHRKNRVRQLKHTIARLKASLGVEKIRSGACYSLFKKELVLAHKGKARAARWKAAAKIYRNEKKQAKDELQHKERQFADSVNELVDVRHRAARWKAAAKRWWKSEWTCWEMAENLADKIIDLERARESLLDELKATRKELEIALKWRAKYKAELERMKGGSDE